MTLEELREWRKAALGGGGGMLGGSIVRNPDGSWSHLSTEQTLAAQAERQAREEATVVMVAVSQAAEAGAEALT